jgi:hypothetical protein
MPAIVLRRLETQRERLAMRAPTVSFPRAEHRLVVTL